MKLMKKMILLLSIHLPYFFVATALSSLPIVELSKLRQQNHAIQYFPQHGSIPFQFLPLPYHCLSQEQPYVGHFDETFVTKIPKGCVGSILGIVIFNNNIIYDFMTYNQETFLRKKSFSNPKKIIGKVAVITQPGAICFCNWMIDVLGRFVLLQQSGIEYDWLYVPLSKSYMKETLALMGVDLKKVIEPQGENYFIQADELIVPSLVNSVNGRGYQLATYVPLWHIEALKNKFLPMIQEQVDFSKMPKKLFISRKSAPRRRMLNEDEVFALFESKGFVKYELEKLSILEQMALFYQADTIVAAHGAALTHIMFCKPGSKIIELFQARPDATFWYMSQMLGLQHICVKTGSFATDHGYIDTNVSTSSLDDVLTTL